MREIKFRIWNSFLEIMEEPTTWLPDYNEGGKENWAKIMQFTGLKDKGGKEVYEGDIIKNNHCSFVIEWEDIGAGLGVGFNFRDNVYEDFEIIGNIYQNPEMLK